MLLVPCVGAIFSVVTSACDGTTSSTASEDLPDAGTIDSSTADGSVNIVEGGQADAPPGCDTAKDPKDSLPCVVDSFGVFVDGTSGVDTNPGTKEKPYKTIGAAIAGVGAKPRVYICAGSYPENLTVQSATSLYGGFACGSWSYSGANTKVNPSTGVALTLTGVTGSVIEDLEFDGSANPAVQGDSAIAVFASRSTVRFVRAKLSAGDGITGGTGTTVSNWTGTATMGTAAANGGQAVMCTCTDATTSTGGKGGAIGAGGDPGVANPPVGTLNGGGGGNTCINGVAGANGAAASGGSGATKAGTLSAAGWTNASDATKGKSGNPAQGGGGGGGRTGVTGGGGGGCGGCGGGAGGPGGNGGSSFALLSFNSSVTTVGGLFVSGQAGSGGPGGPGQDGESGAPGGPGACDGATGGAGAGGSGGGGGAGGVSAPVGFVGTGPTVSGTTLTPGTKGGPGGGGGAGAGSGNGGNAGNPGADGKAGTQVSL